MEDRLDCTMDSTCTTKAILQHILYIKTAPGIIEHFQAVWLRLHSAGARQTCKASKNYNSNSALNEDQETFVSVLCLIYMLISMQP